MNDEQLIFEQYQNITEGLGGFGNSGYSYGLKNRLFGALGSKSAAAKAGIEKQANNLMKQLKFDAAHNGFEDIEEAINGPDKNWFKTWLSRHIGADVSKLPQNFKTTQELTTHIHDLNQFLKTALAEGRRFASTYVPEPVKKELSPIEQANLDKIKAQTAKLQEPPQPKPVPVKEEPKEKPLNALQLANIERIKAQTELNRRRMDAIEQRQRDRKLKDLEGTPKENKEEASVQPSPKAQAIKAAKAVPEEPEEPKEVTPKDALAGKTIQDVFNAFPRKRDKTGNPTGQGYSDKLWDVVRDAMGDPMSRKEFEDRIKSIKFENTSFIDCNEF